MKLKDKIAIITGAASGIGVETARALASAGAATVIAARDDHDDPPAGSITVFSKVPRPSMVARTTSPAST